MAMFLAEITFLLELALFVAGLILLYKARKETSKLLKWAAAVLIIGSLGTITCTAYYSLKYFNQGAFESAYLTGKITIKQRSKQRAPKKLYGKEL